MESRSHAARSAGAITRQCALCCLRKCHEASFRPHKPRVGCSRASAHVRSVRWNSCSLSFNSPGQPLLRSLHSCWCLKHQLRDHCWCFCDCGRQVEVEERQLSEGRYTYKYSSHRPVESGAAGVRRQRMATQQCADTLRQREVQWAHKVTNRVMAGSCWQL